MNSTRAARLIETNGIRIKAVVEGAGPLVLMVHGFPESWYSWRHQLAPIAEAGFTAAAIDVRGYGGSDKPPNVADYGLDQITADVAGVIDVLGGGKAILIGHDWGSPIVYNTAIFHPDKVRAVAGLSVPYLGAPARPFTEVFREFFTSRGMFFYQEYFQEPGVAEAELDADPRAMIRKFYYAISGDAPDLTWPIDKKVGDLLLHRLPDPQPFPAWLSKADEDFYTAEFAASGFRGGLNRYRNHERDFAFIHTLKDHVIRQPSLFIGGTRDLVLKMMPGTDMVALMQPHMADLRGCHLIEGCGHWTQQERPAEVNALLLPWLKAI